MLSGVSSAKSEAAQKTAVRTKAQNFIRHLYRAQPDTPRIGSDCDFLFPQRARRLHSLQPCTALLSSYRRSLPPRSFSFGAYAIPISQRSSNNTWCRIVSCRIGCAIFWRSEGHRRDSAFGRYQSSAHLENRVRRKRPIRKRGKQERAGGPLSAFRTLLSLPAFLIHSFSPLQCVPVIDKAHQLGEEISR